MTVAVKAEEISDISTSSFEDARFVAACPRGYCRVRLRRNSTRLNPAAELASWAGEYCAAGSRSWLLACLIHLGWLSLSGISLGGIEEFKIVPQREHPMGL